MYGIPAGVMGQAAGGKAGQGPPDAVNAEPKLFVGQLLPTVTREDVLARFSSYGAVKNCTLMINHDTGKSKGCAMVTYDKFSHAEAAMEAENGTHYLSGDRQLVVKFADPTRKEDGRIVGITPKKLFVGQVPMGMTDEALREVFAPYGNVVDLHVMRKTAGQNNAYAAFVAYDRWAAAEMALETLNGKVTLPGAALPMAVRFADGRFPGGGKRSANDAGVGSSGLGMGKRPFGLGGLLGMGGMITPQMMGMMGVNGMGMGGMAMPGGGMMMPGMGMGGGALVNAMGNPQAMGGMAQAGMQQQQQQQYQGGGSGGQEGGAHPQANAAGGTGAAAAGYGMGGGLMAGAMMPMMMGMGAAGMMGAFGGGGAAMRTDRTQVEAAKAWKLFLGQISYDLEEFDLRPHFAPYGNILELTLLKKPDGSSRGYGFLTYSTREEADAAVQATNGTVLPNDPRQRRIIVKFA